MTIDKIDFRSCRVDTTELVNELGMLTDSLIRGEFNSRESLERINTLAMCTMALSLNDICEALTDINVAGIAVYLQEEE